MLSHDSRTNLRIKFYEANDSEKKLNEIYIGLNPKRILSKEKIQL